MDAVYDALGGAHPDAHPDAREERDAGEGAVIYTQAGVALPCEAARRARGAGHAQRRLEAVDVGATRYVAHSFTARSTRHAATLEAAYRLRAHILMGELGWLMPSADGRERDRCDTVARHFVVFAHTGEGRRSGAAASSEPGGGALVGYARALLPRHGFMLQREFAELAPGAMPTGVSAGFAPDPERAFEVTRFVVRPSHRGWRCVEGRTAVDHLARAIAQWAIAAGRSEWYTVCEARHLRALRLRGLRFTQLGAAREYQPRVEACAALLRLPEAAAELRANRPSDYHWYLHGAPEAGQALRALAARGGHV